MEHADRSFLLQFVQPGLLGLMDGTVSTLAPLFASVYATGSSHITLLIGTSAAIGAAISMGFAEALSDTGIHTGRGHPLRRGLITGTFTLIGGIVHTIPFLLPNVREALTIAYVIVGFELLLISYIRHRYFRMNIALSILQVIVGGACVIAAGILVGSS